MVIFNIKTKAGLPSGAQIANYAGIFFDDNPVVMTDTVTNQIGLPSITGLGNVCIGDSITLTSPTGFGGGIWASGSTAIATIGSVSGIVKSISASTVSISYTFTNSCGSTPVSTVITVDALPTAYPVTGGGGYCAGSTGVHIGLDTSAVGTNYYLYYVASLVSTVSGTGSALDFGLHAGAGSYTVMATNPATTCSNVMEDSAVLYIASPVTPSLSITTGPGDTLCEGIPVSFTPVPINGGLTPGYLWNINGTNVSTADSYTFLPADGDLVTLTFTSSAPCAIPPTIIDSLRMTVVTPLVPSTGITAVPGTSIETGTAVTLSAGVTGGGTTTSYQWFLNGVGISGATDATYSSNTFADQDSVTCGITTANACGEVTLTTFVIISVSNNEGIIPTAAQEYFSIFPNPNNGAFTVIATLGVAEGSACLTITDMIGQVAYSSIVPAINGKINAQIQLNKELAKGVYMLNLRSGPDNRVVHFVVE